MSVPDDMTELIEAATAARQRAYAPYSGFRMGAAVRTTDGDIVNGALVENVSLPSEVEQALDKRTSMGMIGNLRDYATFQAAEAILSAAHSGLRIGEVPITVKRRLSGESKKGRDLAYGVGFARSVLKSWWR